MKSRYYLFIASVVLILSVSSCSRKTAEEAAAELAEEIKVAQVRLGKKAEIAFTKDPKFTQGNQVKWNSGVKETIYTKHGRLVKTQNFNNGNLIFSYSSTTDPLELGLLKASTPRTWTRIVDWSPTQMGVVLNSKFAYIGKEKIRIPSKTLAVETHFFLEKISVPSRNISYVDKFWVDEKTGLVIKSVQHFNPKQPALTLVFEI